jgi:miniconductance mechanosensitive channel
VDQTIRDYVIQGLSYWGNVNLSDYGFNFGLMLFIAICTYLVARRLLTRFIYMMVEKSASKWDDFLITHQVFEKISLLMPLIVVSAMLPLTFSASSFWLTFWLRACHLFIVFQSVRICFSLLDVGYKIAEAMNLVHRMPIKSLVQLIKLFVFFIFFILSIAIVTGRSPLYLLSGLGVATGLVMLVFRDTILGFVAGIQLSANRMVSQGDWIEMPKYGADGDVEEVSLTTIKVRNWDKTISMIPAYALVSDSFRNWRGMNEAKARRIKRSLLIDVTSIRRISDHELAAFQGEPWLQAYQDTVKTSHCLTNIGLFRVFVQYQLSIHPDIRQDLTLIVRQLEMCEHGVPLEVYAFCQDIRWASYEAIQSEIFENLLASLQQFHLRPYQNISSYESFKGR